jgi:heme o synthase
VSDLSYRLEGENVATICNASPSDFVQLLKPRVMSLVVLSALAGMLLTPGHLHPVIGFSSLIAIAIGAGAAGALNMWYDADIDRVMIRTRGRPIPSGRIDRDLALIYGLVLAAFSVVTLGLVANWLAAALLAFTIFFYIVIYSMWLKRLTPQNIVIGGAAGALPPVVAYAAAAGSVSVSSIVLFAIIFVWTPPHFWALALIKSGDYARAGIPMMPNVKGPDRTRLEILVYSVLLAPLGVLPFVLGFGSPLYGAMSTVLGALFVVLALRVYRQRRGEEAETAAKHLFAFSILYLFILLAIIVAEHGLGLASFAAQ